MIRIRSSVIGRCSRVKSFFSTVSFKSESESESAAEDVIDDMLKRRPLPSIVEFNQEIHEMSKNREDVRAIESYKKIALAGVKPSVYTMSIVINCYGNLKEFIDRGLSLLGHSIKSGLEVNDYVITSVVKGFLSETRLEEAKTFVEKICRFDERPSSPFMYNLLLKASCEREAKDDYKGGALEVFDTMPCQPDKVSYTIIINHLFEKKQVDEGVTMLTRLLSDSSVSLDSKLFGAGIRGLLEQKQSQAARILFVLMVQKKVRFESSFMNMLLGYYMKRNMIKHGEAVFSFMMKRQIPHNLITCNTLLFGYSVSEDVASAEKLYFLMSSSRGGSSPDIVSATTMLSCYCNIPSLVKKGFAFFKVNFGRKDGLFSANTFTYGTMIRGFFKAGNVDGARRLMSEMNDLGIASSQKFYGMVLDGYLSNGCVALADSYFRDPQNECFNGDVAVWNILIKGALVNGQVGLAKAYRKEMLGRGIKPDSMTYAT